MNILDSISYHAVYDDSLTEALIWAKEHGFSGIQISTESPHFVLDRMTKTQIEGLSRIAENLGIYIVLHAVDNDASLFQPDQYLKAGIQSYYASLLETAAALPARLITIHAGEPVRFPTDSWNRDIPEADAVLYRDIFRENMEHILEANRYKVPICIENHQVHALTQELLLPYLKNVDLFLCFDIAKSHARPEDESFFLDHTEWIKQVHLHDRRKDSKSQLRSHCAVGTGEIDFPAYLLSLSQADVLDYCIEVRPREKALESLEYLRTVLS